MFIIINYYKNKNRKLDIIKNNIKSINNNKVYRLFY